nr:hypothetical protein GLBDPPGF_00002 [uncultured bacterium]
MVVRGSFGEPNWFRASLIPALVAVVVAAILTNGETWLIWRKRHATRLAEANRRIAELESAPTPPAPPTSVVVGPKAEVTFDCDRTGWARLRVTNTGTGATFSAIIQPYQLLAGAVQGRQVYAKWELGEGPLQRLAAGETRTIRLASVREIGRALEARERLLAWTLHRADGDDINGIEDREYVEVRLVADPDLAEPCQLQVLLDAAGSSRMARIGVDEAIVHKVPKRVEEMRRLLAEVVDYLSAMPIGQGNTKAAVWMAVMTHDHVADLLGQAFGPRETAVYGTRLQDGGASMLELSTQYLLAKAQSLTEDEILGSFELPITWAQFYERQPGWEWPAYD